MRSDPLLMEARKDLLSDSIGALGKDSEGKERRAKDHQADTQEHPADRAQDNNIGTQIARAGSILRFATVYSDCSGNRNEQTDCQECGPDGEDEGPHSIIPVEENPSVPELTPTALHLSWSEP